MLAWDKEEPWGKWTISILAISILEVFKPWSSPMVQGWPRVLQVPFQPTQLVPATSAEPNPTMTPQRTSTRAWICLLVGMEGLGYLLLPCIGLQTLQPLSRRCQNIAASARWEGPRSPAGLLAVLRNTQEKSELTSSPPDHTCLIPHLILIFI